jgi:hypothetical protein
MKWRWLVEDGVVCDETGKPLIEAKYWCLGYVDFIKIIKDSTLTILSWVGLGWFGLGLWQMIH